VEVVDNLSNGKRENLNPKAVFHQMDITSTEVQQIFERGRYDIVNHHAAQASVSVSVKEPALDARINILGVINLLENCVKHGVKKFIFASSGGTVYGATDKLPAVETLPFDAGSPYGVSKVATELYLRVYSQVHGLKYTALRYANVYGPRQDPHGEAGVVAIFSMRMLASGRPVIFGDGENMRDYVYVGDVVDANLRALAAGDNDFFNIGTGVRVSTNKLFKVMKELTGFKGADEHGPARAGDLRDSCLDASKAGQVLGWAPKVSIESGLRTTVDWFRAKAA
jgi:UDP-glucose 4-epimerase